MSPRAAWRLESLGFQRAVDFVPGKEGWYDENEPHQGKAEEEIWLGDVANSNVPTCSLTDRVGEIRDRVRAAGWDTCVVVNEHRAVLGLLRKKALDANPDDTAEEVMYSGPSTFRPSVTLAEQLKFMRDRNIKTNSLVTTLGGKLIGVISRDDAEATSADEGQAGGRLAASAAGS